MNSADAPPRTESVRRHEQQQQERRIQLHVSNGKAYVWDAQGGLSGRSLSRRKLKSRLLIAARCRHVLLFRCRSDVALLRVHHRITGLTAGTLPGVAQQNAFLGLPLLLAPEEVVLLLSLRVAELFDTRAAHVPPTPEQVAERTHERVQAARAMQVAAEEAAKEKRRAFEAKRSEGPVRARKGLGADSKEARKKREERKAQKGQDGGDEGDAESLFAPVAADAPVPVAPQAAPSSLQEADASAGPLGALTSATYFTAIPATSTSSPWFQPDAQHAIYGDLASARAAGVWVYPSTRLERARCATFERVWEEGMFAGHGIKFGGEFLVYPGECPSLGPSLAPGSADGFCGSPGDPLRYHSHFVTTSLPSLHTPIRPLELVAWGRLGTATKKAHLLCAYAAEDERKDGEDEGEVECWSLEWGNFG